MIDPRRGEAGRPANGGLGFDQNPAAEWGLGRRCVATDKRRRRGASPYYDDGGNVLRCAELHYDGDAVGKNMRRG